MAQDYTDLVRVTLTSGEHTVRVVGTLIGRRNRPHLLEVWGQRFAVQLEDHITILRYRDVPGMIGRVGTCFGGTASTSSPPPSDISRPPAPVATTAWPSWP